MELTNYLCRAISLCYKHGWNQSASGTSKKTTVQLFMPSCLSESSHCSAGSRGRSRSKGWVQFSLVSLVQNPLGIWWAHAWPQPLGSWRHLPQGSPTNSGCAGSSVMPACSIWQAHRPSLPFLAFAFSCISSFLFISPPKGDICKLQTAEKHSLGVWQSPKQVRCSSARPPEQFTSQNCVIYFPRSLKSLTEASKAKSVARWGARPIPTLVIPSPSHHSTFHTHFSHVAARTPSEYQPPLTILSSPSAAGWHAQGHWPAADGQTPEGMEPACLFLLQWLWHKAECQTLPRVQAGAAGGRARWGRREPPLFLFQEKLIWKRETSPTVPASRWRVGQLPSLLMDPTLIH